MAVFRPVKTLVSRSIKNPSNCAHSRAFFSLMPSSRSPIQAAFLLPTDCYNRRVFLFRSRPLNSNGREVVKTGAELDVVVDGGGISDSYPNLPNFISFTRLLSGPLLAWMITHEMYSSAFIGLAISGASDWLDGFVARKIRINSVVGSYLDPLADKVLIGCVALAMVDKGLLNPGVVALVVLHDVALVGGAVYKRAESFD